jgi:hypothetical protein
VVAGNPKQQQRLSETCVLHDLLAVASFRKAGATSRNG